MEKHEINALLLENPDLSKTTDMRVLFELLIMLYHFRIDGWFGFLDCFQEMRFGQVCSVNIFGESKREASLQTPAISAPEKPSVKRASFPRSISAPSGTRLR